MIFDKFEINKINLKIVLVYFFEFLGYDVRMKIEKEFDEFIELKI